MGMIVTLTFASFQLSLQIISYFEIRIIFQFEIRADETSSFIKGGAHALSTSLGLSGSELIFFS